MVEEIDKSVAVDSAGNVLEVWRYSGGIKLWQYRVTCKGSRRGMIDHATSERKAKEAAIVGLYQGTGRWEKIRFKRIQHGSQKAQRIRPVRQPHEEAGEGTTVGA